MSTTHLLTRWTQPIAGFLMGSICGAICLDWNRTTVYQLVSEKIATVPFGREVIATQEHWKDESNVMRIEASLCAINEAHYREDDEIRYMCIWNNKFRWFFCVPDEKRAM